MLLYRSSPKIGSTEGKYDYCVRIGNNKLKGSVSYVFYENTEFNEPVIIGENVYDCSYLFGSCTNYNQPITIPQNVTNIRGMLFNCTSFGENIYINGNTFRTISTASMLSSCNTQKQKNIMFNIILNNQFNNTTMLGSLVYRSIEWTTMTNGFYNSAYNIYCYTNYAG